MRCGHPLQVSVRTFNEQIESRAIVRIVGMQDAGCQNDQILLEKHQTMKSSDFTLFTFDIPDERWQFGEFELHVLFQSLKSNEEIVRKSLPIRLLATFQVFLIELDKPLYRPGESVKVRVLKLVGSSLSPAYSSPKPSPIEIFLKVNR